MDKDRSFNQRNNEDSVFSVRLKAGKRRTYFFDVKSTRSNDYYITITESKKKLDADGYEKHKLHLYKEDFNRFMEAMQEVIDHVKQELMPDYDFDEFDRNREQYLTEQNENLPPNIPPKKLTLNKSKEDTPYTNDQSSEKDDDLKWE